MVGAGMGMILASVLGLYFSYRETLVQKKWFLRGMVALISFPFIANSAGWIMTEIGRQPWTVFGLMTTSASVSPNVSAQSLLLSLIAFSLAYTILAIVLFYLFVREIKKGVEHHETAPETQTIDPFDQEVYM